MVNHPNRTSDLELARVRVALAERELLALYVAASERAVLPSDAPNRVAAVLGDRQCVNVHVHRALEVAVDTAGLLPWTLSMARAQWDPRNAELQATLEWSRAFARVLRSETLAKRQFNTAFGGLQAARHAHRAEQTVAELKQAEAAT